MGKKEQVEGTALLWSLEALARHVRHEDAEVRAWAAGRLIQQFPDRCADLVAPLILDEPTDMAERVAEHLARYGSASHRSILERGARHGRDRVPGVCLEALARLGHPSLEEIGAAAVGRRDLSDEGAALVLAALLRHGEPSLAREIALAQMRARPAVVAEHDACRELFARLDPADFPTLVAALLASLAWRGGDGAATAFSAIGEALEAEDAGWLLHTDGRNRILVERTLKAYDATYDTEVRRNLGPTWEKTLSRAFADGDLPTVARSVLAYCRERAPEVSRSDDTLPARIRAAVEALAEPRVVEDVERVGPSAAEAAVVMFLSCALKLADFRSFGREIEAAGRDLDRLLPLLEVESSGLLDRLPEAIEAAVRDASDRERAVQRAAQVLGRRGPWYGRLMALDLLGRLRSVEEAHEVIRGLEDDNHHVLEAAGHALERMGPEVVPAIRAAYEDGHPDAESLEWMVAAICQAGSVEALAFVLQHLDELVADLDPGFVAEWVAALGAEELIPRLRDLLESDLARVGHGLLLVSAIHNRHVPEEDRILQAIDRSHQEEPGPEGMEGGAGGGGGPYLM
jgi:hypothetical protein